MKKGKNLQEKGITLVALVITIIVLLILVGVTLRIVFNGGIIDKSQNAVDQYSYQSKNEEEQLAEFERWMEQYFDGKYVEDDEPTKIAYYVGDYVKVGNEYFYVIKDSGENEEKVTLLAEKNINTSSLEQSDSANPVAFSNTNYWFDYENGEIISYDLNSLETEVTTDVINIVKAYGTKIGTELGTEVKGRLISLEEIEKLGGSVSDNSTSACPGWVNTVDFWLGTAHHRDTSSVWELFGEELERLHDGLYHTDYRSGVRPVIEISKSYVTLIERGE